MTARKDPRLIDIVTLLDLPSCDAVCYGSGRTVESIMPRKIDHIVNRHNGYGDVKYEDWNVSDWVQQEPILIEDGQVYNGHHRVAMSLLTGVLFVLWTDDYADEWSE